MKKLSIEAILSTGFQPFQPLVRIVTDSFHHHDQVAPFHRIRPAPAVIGRQPERALFQTFHIQYHAAVFCMEELHGGPASVYEDEDIIVVNKARGMVVHPAVGNWNGTLVNALMYHCGDRLSGINGEIRPGIVHRIDKDTSGLLVVARNDLAHQSLAEQIACHSAAREYQAIVVGAPREDQGTIDQPIGRHKVDRKKMAIVPDGRHAVTHYQVLKRFRGYSLLAFQLETGRTHQIRVHMASIGHPIIGDPLYGLKKDRFSSLDGQCLHAWRLSLDHPRTGERMVFEAPLPEYFTAILNKMVQENG